jgi:hypothetical protein
MLRTKCPGLRVLAYRDIRGRPVWTIRFDSRRDHTARQTAIDVGHIDVFIPTELKAGQVIDGWRKLRAPTSAYTIRRLVDLQVTSSARSDFDKKETRTTLLKPHTSRHLRSIDVKGLSLCLDDMATIYHEQKQVRGGVRLAAIRQHDVDPWSIKDFGNFARAARDSLTSLNLEPSSYSPSLVQTSFADSLKILKDIQTELPHLRKLSIPVKLLGAAETSADLLSMLLKGTIDTAGSLTTLRLQTGPCDTPLFNILRVLGSFCRADSEAVIDFIGHQHSWSEADQIDYQRYLKRYVNPSHITVQ